MKAESGEQDQSVKEKTAEEYKVLLAIMMGFIDDFYENPLLYMTHTELMEQRTVDILNYAFTGYGKTFDEAMEIIRNTDISDLTDDQIQERQMLIDLTDNLINFAVAEEHQVLMEMQQDAEDADDKDEFISLATGTFSKFNKTYATVENDDVLFAMGLAAEWALFEDNQIIEFKTQGDERVRASHQALDGLRYRKNSFPAALVPPIAHGCRCFLINTGSTDGRKLTNKANVGELISAAGDPTFKNNVATSGMMFSEEHPYFSISSSNSKILSSTVRKIKIRLGL